MANAAQACGLDASIKRITQSENEGSHPHTRIAPVMKMAARTRRPLSTLHVNTTRSTMRPYSVSTSMILYVELKVKRPRAVAESIRCHCYENASCRGWRVTL